jgi:CheY-like chemotaxis protein
VLVASVLRKRVPVLEASRGEEAVALVERHSTTIHLLLSDLIMPGMSGRGPRDALRPTRVLLMSGYSERQSCIQDRDEDALHKSLFQWNACSQNAGGAQRSRGNVRFGAICS